MSRSHVSLLVECTRREVCIPSLLRLTIFKTDSFGFCVELNLKQIGARRKVCKEKKKY